MIIDKTMFRSPLPSPLPSPSMIYLLGFLIHCVTASPIPAQSNTHAHPDTFIFVAIAILALLAFLSVIKCLYMKHRRVGVSEYHSQSCSYYDPVSIDSYCRSSSGTLPTAVAPANKEDLSVTSTTTSSWHFGSGFFVGFFGSPAWETNLSHHAGSGSGSVINLLNPVHNWSQQPNSSSLSPSIYQTQAMIQARQAIPRLSLKSRSSKCKRKSSSLSSLVNKNNDDANRRQDLSKSRSLNHKLPRHPESIHQPSLSRHSYSLPSSVRRLDRFTPSTGLVGDFETGKNSGCGSNRLGRNRLTSTCRHKSNSRTSDASLRLLNPMDVSAVPLPLSPTFSIPSSPLSIANPFPADKLRIKTRDLQALHKFPALRSQNATLDPFSSAAKASSTVIPLPSTSGPRLVQISHPFALAHLPKIMANASTNPQIANITMQGRSRDSQLYQELLPVLKPLDVHASPAELDRQNQGQNMTMNLKSQGHTQATGLKPVICRNSNLVSVSQYNNSSSSEYHMQTSPPLPSSLPPVPILSVSRDAANISASHVLPANIKPQRKPRMIGSGGRTRTSVVFGPSPLRMMILPDTSSSGLDIRSPRAVDDAKNAAKNSNRKSEKGNDNDKENRRSTMDGTHRDDFVPRSFGSGSNSFNARSSGLGEFGDFSEKYKRAEIRDGRGSVSDDESARASMNASMASRILLDLVREREQPCVETDGGSLVEEVDLGLERFTLTDGCSKGSSDTVELDFVSFWEEAKLLESDSDIGRQRQSVVGVAQ